MPKVKYSWTQPCCPKCWVGLVLKTGRSVDRPTVTFCCFCRAEVPEKKGYNIRVNPGTVPYPTTKAEDD